jgi:lysylphosphatidylglycerol synthetase-like protein (DUF2156 family)/UDP-2,3-diacylglucosamine pyrophosphatase LpxH
VKTGHDGADLGAAGLAPGAGLQRNRPPLPQFHELVEIEVPRGGRVVVVSDLHLTGTRTETSAACTDEIVRVLAGWDGPGVLVIAGDGFEQLHDPVAPIGDILDAHRAWAEAVGAFARTEGRHVVVLSGNHDGNIAWDARVADTLADRLGARLALAVDLLLDTGEGTRRVHVVHGNQDDEYNAFVDPRSPLDTPTGHHVVRQVLPALDRAVRPGGLLEGLYGLSEPLLAGEMVGSRLLYRRVGRSAWLLLVPFLAVLPLRVLTQIPALDHIRVSAQGWLLWFGVIAVSLLVLGVVVAALTLYGVHQTLTTTQVGQRAGIGAHNAMAREHAARVVERGYAGMVTGHTHQPELSAVGDGFYANSGCGIEVLGPRRARLGLPRPFVSVRRRSRVELTAGRELGVQLVVGDLPIVSPSALERLVMAPDHTTPTVPTAVASLPGGATWPVDVGSLGAASRVRRTRRRAARALLVVAGLDLLATLFGGDLPAAHLFAADLRHDIPEAAGVLVAIVAVALVGLARGTRRGGQRAWATATVLLGVSALALVARGDAPELVTLNLVVAGWLLLRRRHFRVLVGGRRAWAVRVAALAVGTAALSIGLAVEFGSGLVDRLTTIAIAVGLGLLVLVALLAGRPDRHRQRSGDERRAAERLARRVVESAGGDTFDHSVLRDDKALLFAGDGVVAYRVVDGCMCVSPDPVCPVGDRAEVWASALDHADTHGWRIAVLAASAGWLPVYHASGMHDVLVGDEAIVDRARFAQGGHVAVDRGAQGYTVTVHRAADLDPPLRLCLADLATDAEPSGTPRGFATSLGRLAGPDDPASLVALCRAGDGNVVAFQQFVAAPAIRGWTLDLSSTRQLGPAAESVGHLLLAEALCWMAAHDVEAVSLGLVASGDLSPDVCTGIAAPLGGADELERHRRFAEAYGPLWRPRYVVVDSMRATSRVIRRVRAARDG